MKKVVCFGLCFLIVLSSFVLCFADTNFEQPVILPLGDPLDGSSSVSLTLTSGTTHYYSSNIYPVYMCVYQVGSSKYVLYFSEDSSAIVYDKGASSVTNRAMNAQYNGFYYFNTMSVPESSSIMVFSEGYGPTDVIDYVNNTVFKTTFDVSSLVNGSISWLSSLAQAAKASPLLLFFVLFIFVGIGIGLLNRFRR